MEERPKETQAYPALLEQLRQSRSELERLPPSSCSQLVIVALGIGVGLVVVTGIIPLSVPLYLLLPFVLIPGWRVYNSERDRRARLRAVVDQIRIVEERWRGR